MITYKAKIQKVLNNIIFTKQSPISVVHFLTNRCNARCSFCFIDFDNPNTFKNELSLDEIKILTKNFGETLLNVNFTGGEPFARKDITEIAKSYIDNTTIQSIYITTNGSLPERVISYAREIHNYNSKIEQSFQISVDHFPENHDRVRKIKDLFNNCLKTYEGLKKLNIENIQPSINITVSQENCKKIKDIFYYLINDCGIDSIKCCIVRDEGIYKTPNEKKKEIYDAYIWLTGEISKLKKHNKINNYSNSIQSKIHNKKDEISWDMVKKMYMDNKYISPCHASSLFGVITADGKVYPCEILEDKLIGDLRSNKMNFINLWKSKKNSEIKSFIKDTKCRCTYECALSFNILGNWRYQFKLLSSIL